MKTRRSQVLTLFAANSFAFPTKTYAKSCRKQRCIDFIIESNGIGAVQLKIIKLIKLYQEYYTEKKPWINRPQWFHRISSH